MFRPAAIACLLLPGLLLSSAAAATPQAAAPKGSVVLYRCVGSQGTIAVRDSPCPAGQRQQVITMQRPQDPPPSARPAPARPEKPAVPEREVRVVIAQPPRPMYECVAPDGERYASDTADGRQRWVPAWVYGYPVRPPAGPRAGASAGLSVTAGANSGNRSAAVSIGGQTGTGHPSPHGPNVAVPVGGTWVRDECHALPQQEVCARLSDRRYEILRRYGSAMPSERRALDLEQRGIDARMASDCTGW